MFSNRLAVAALGAGCIAAAAAGGFIAARQNSVPTPAAAQVRAADTVPTASAVDPSAPKPVSEAAASPCTAYTRATITAVTSAPPSIRMKNRKSCSRSVATTA